MKTVVVLPMGAHPFHPGHYALYQSAVKTFPGADVYIAATADTSQRPFPFQIKQKLAKLSGVPENRFVQVKSPFQAREITADLDPNNTQLIFVRSEKDADKPPQAGGVKKDGNPAYLQPYDGQGELAPMSQHAYMAYLPTVEFGPGMTSATEIRTAWPKLNEKRKTALVMSLYPKTQTNPKLAATVVKMLDTAIGGEQLDENSGHEFILYINNKPAAKYTDLKQEEQDLYLIKSKVPTAKFEIKKEVCNMVAVPIGLKEALLKEFAQGVAEASKPARVNKLGKAPKPKNQQEYDAIEKYRKDLAQSYKPNKEQGVAEGSRYNPYGKIKFLNKKTGEVQGFYYWQSVEGPEMASSMVTNNQLVPAHDDGTEMSWEEFKQALTNKNKGVAEAASNNIQLLIQKLEDMSEAIFGMLPGSKKNRLIDKRDELEARIEAMPGGKEALRKWAREYNDSFDEGVAEGSLNEFAPDGFNGGDNRSKLLGTVGRLLKAGNKVDWQVPGQMGHVTQVKPDGITMKKWKQPHSRMSFFLPMYDDSRDSKYTVKMVAPKHYAVVSAEEGVAEAKTLKKEVVGFTRESEFKTWKQYAQKEGYKIREAGNLPGSYAAFDDNGKRVGYFYNKFDLPNGYYHIGELITSVEDVAEGYSFKGKFPFDVDHMPGAVIRNRDETSDVVKTNNKDKWDDAVDIINDEVFDDMSDFRTNSEGERVTGHSAVWAVWDNATQTGWYNRKGQQLKPWPIKDSLNEFDPGEGHDRPKFIPWHDFIEGVKGIVGKDFEVVEKVVKSTIQARFIPHDAMEFGPTMLYSYYEARLGRNKGAVSTRGSIQVGKYVPNRAQLGKQNFITTFNLLKGHPFERHFDLTPENISKIASIILGNTEGAYQMPQQQGVAEDYIDEKK